MAGHSHWANIQRTKAKVDAKRGKVFSKWAKLIMSAARTGGSDPDMNLQLRYAIERAKADNMPKDSIERAVKKGAGELEGQQLEEVMYEGYAPGGVALMIETLTNNRNRTAPNIRHILAKRGGSMANSGSVAWMFKRKAVFAIPKSACGEEELMMLALEHGADDVSTDEAEVYVVEAEPGAFLSLQGAFDEAGWETLDAAIRYIPDNTVEVPDSDADKIQAIVDAVEDDEDVQAVHHNAEFV